MKRFQFSLQKLLNYKEQVLQREKNDLAGLRRQLQQALDEKDRLWILVNQANGDFTVRSSRGMTPPQIVLAKAYINQLLEQIRLLEGNIRFLGERIEKQLGVVIEATKEVSSLEKLQEKQLEDYTKAFQKEEELFISEYVSNSTFYSSSV